MITEKTSLGEIIDKYPGAVGVLRSFDVKLGCSGADVFDSIGTVAKTQDIDAVSLLKKLNNLKITEEHSDSVTISLTDVAAKKMKEMIPPGGKGLRFGVTAGGCAGYTYSMEFDDRKETDVATEDKGLKIFVDRVSASKVNGVVIDYVESLQASGFKINNPNAKATCGCGKSAAV